MISKNLFNIISRFLNLCENDSGSPETEYNKIYIYKDGNGGRKQLTLSRGFTCDGGNLKKVVVRYIQKGGILSDMFKKRLDKFGKGILISDTEFIKGLVSAGTEQAMKDAQDEIFNEVYLGPAIKWADINRFKENLSIAVIADSYLHSGQMTPFLMQKFSEKKPGSGGDEKIWIKSYLEQRLAWFERVSGPLHTCMFRPQFFLNEIEKDNWELSCPLTVKEKGKIC